MIEVIFFIPMLIVGIVLFTFGLFKSNRKRLIESIPTSKIRSIAMGLIEIYGKVTPINQSVLKSPFSLKDCVYYKYNIDEYRSTGKSSAWITIAKGEEKIPFYVQDETGKVTVDPSGAKIEISKDFQIQSGMGTDPPGSVKQFLRTKNLRFEGVLFGINKTMRFIEYFIEPNDHLYVLGTAADNPFKKDATALKGEEDIIITKGVHEKLFYISDKPEKNILKNLSISSKAFMIFGAFIAIMSLMVLLL